jgi:hypothetical protein
MWENLKLDSPVYFGEDSDVNGGPTAENWIHAQGDVDSWIINNYVFGLQRPFSLSDLS